MKPDMVSMAKGMGGGMPIGAMCCTSKVATAMNPGSHGSTYAGSPVCCAACSCADHERFLTENFPRMRLL